LTVPPTRNVIVFETMNQVGIIVIIHFLITTHMAQKDTLAIWHTRNFFIMNRFVDMKNATQACSSPKSFLSFFGKQLTI
jgi:hypothetical protein